MYGSVGARRRLVTTNFVLAELHALLLTRLDRRVAARVLEEVDASNRPTTVVRVATRDERRARQIVFGYTDKDFSLTDTTSFAVMVRLRIPQAFTLDRNFAQFGWACVGIPLTALESSPTHERARPPLLGQLAAGAIAERAGAPLATAVACAAACWAASVSSAVTTTCCAPDRLLRRFRIISHTGYLPYNLRILRAASMSALHNVRGGRNGRVTGSINTRPRPERIEARLSSEAKAVIQRAADISGPP